MFKMFSNKKVASSSLSDFVQNTSSGRKKELYIKAMKKANESQNQILREAKIAS